MSRFFYAAAGVIGCGASVVLFIGGRFGPAYTLAWPALRSSFRQLSEPTINQVPSDTHAFLDK